MKKALILLSLVLLLSSCMRLHEASVPTPELLEPEDGAITSIDSPVRLSWEVRSPFSGWTFEVFLEVPGNGIILDEKTLETSLEVSDLSPGPYVWWVKLISPQGKTRESEKRLFYYGGPGEITLLSPLGGTVSPENVNFSWKLEKDVGVDHYALIVNGEEIETIENSITLSLDPNATYHWKVVVYTQNGSTYESEEITFKTGPVSIELLGPDDGAVDLHPDSITLKWESAYEGLFEVHLLREGNPVGIWLTSSKSFKLEGLKYDTEYSWYVSLPDEEDGKSEVRTFRTLKPSPPVIISPSNSSSIPPDSFLEWDYNDPNFEPVEFIIFVGYDSEYDHSFTLETKSISIGNLVKKIGEPLESGKDIYWAVQAEDSLGRTTPKAHGMFRINPIELVDPKDGSEGILPDGVVFSWKGDPYYDSYTLYITDGDTTKKFTTSDTKYIVNGLEYNKTYLWYVTGDDIIRSETRSFKTWEVSPPEVVNPADGQVDVEMNDFIMWRFSDPNFDLAYYIFWFGKDPYLDDYIKLYGNSIAITDAAEMFSLTLNSSDVIYWAVQAVDTSGRKSGITRASFRLK